MVQAAQAPIAFVDTGRPASARRNPLRTRHDRTAGLSAQQKAANNTALGQMSGGTTPIQVTQRRAKLTKQADLKMAKP